MYEGITVSGEDASAGGGDAVVGAGRGRSPGRTVLYCALIIAAGVLAYWNSFDGQLMFDDESTIINNPYIRSLWPLDRAMSCPPQSTGSGRPILNLSFAINYHFGGMRVWGYHLVNLAIHLAVGLILFAVTMRTLRLPRPWERFGRAAPELAFASVLLWVVHPIQTESVTYVVQRAESIAALFYVGTLYAFVRYASGCGRGWALAAFLSCAMGMASKETVATAPIMVLLYDWFFLSGPGGGVIRKRRGLHAALWATLAILAAIMSTGPRSQSAGFGENMASPREYALGQFEVITHYLKLIVYPARLCLDYQWPVPESIGQVAGPMAIVLALVALTAWGAYRRAAWAYCGCWFFVILCPTSTFVPILDLAFEHRVYLPLAGLTTGAVCVVYAMILGRRSDESIDASAGIWAWSGGRRGIGAGLCVALLVASGLLIARTRSRNEDYRSVAGMWRDVLEQRPGNFRAVFNLAWEHYQRGDLATAEQELRSAIAMNPEYDRPHSVLAILLSNRGDHAEGLAHATRACELNPNEAECFYNVGLILARMGRDDEAVEYYRRALAIRPDYSDAWYNLGNVEIRRQDWSAAMRCMERAVEFDSDAVGARFNLSGLYRQRGNVQAADELMRDALRVAREAAERARDDSRYEAAVEFQGKVVQILPDDAGERLEWARDLAQAGRRDDAIMQCREAARLGESEAAGRLEAEFRARGGNIESNGAGGE